MKIWLRKNLALFLALCMCISLCPVSVAAENTSATSVIEAVTATAQPLDGATHDPVTLTTASVFPQDCDFYVKFDGLELNEEYRILVQMGSYSTYNYLYAYLNEPIVRSLYYGLSLGSNTVTVTICDDDNNPLYKPVTLTTNVVEHVPVTMEDLQASAELTEVSNLETNFYAYTYLPVGTLTGNEKLSLEMVKNGVVYATTTEDSYCEAYTNYFRDYRYAEILDEETYIPLRVQQVRCEVYCGRELEAGSYDARLYADGELITTQKNAVVCYNTPIVSGLIFSSASGTHNVIGSEMAGITLDITNGDPADFAVELYLEGEKVSVSTGYRVVSASITDCSVVYYIPLDEPMEQNQEYEFRVKYAKEGDFIMRSSDLSKRIYEKVSADRETIQFGSYYYANFALPSFGYDAGVKYKFELVLYGDVISTTYASPNNDGFFNLEFRDEDDQLIELERNASYEIAFYGNLDNPNYESCTWRLYNQYLRREAALSLMSAGETFVLNVENANFFQDSAEWVFVQMIGGDAASIYDENKAYQLRLTSVTGSEYLLDVETADLYDDGYVAEIGFSVPEELDDAYYHVELLYNDKLVVNESGENIFVYGDLLNFSRQVRVSIGRGRSREINAIIGLNPRSLEGKDMTVELFSLLNETTEPDCTLTLTEDNDYTVTDDDMAELNPAVRYMAVISAEGKVLNVTDYEYWASNEAMYTSYDDFGTVTVANGMEDNLEIVPCYTNYDEEEGIPYFSEVYVKVTAPEGKALQYITVNGEKICGNGFLFTEDCEVSAVFAEPDTETYKVTVQMGVYEYVYENGMTEEEAWEYAESLSPEEMEAFYAGLGDSRRVFTVLHSYEVNLPPNSMQELDLSLPAELSNYKFYGYDIDVECADPDQWAGVSSNDAQTRWLLDMPECDVLVKINLQEKQEYSLSAQYNHSLGTVTGLASDYSYVTEGETVSFTAVPTENNLLQSVYYEYYDYRNGGDQHIELTPNANGVYSFVMPAYSVQLYINFTTSGPYNVTAYVDDGSGTVTKSDPVSEEGYMAGETVTITLNPAEGYRLVRKDGIIGRYGIGYEEDTVEFTKVNETTYTFVMPHADVSVAVYYEETPGIAPGGTVTDNDTLITALGGADNAVLNDATGAVQLLQNVELLAPILFAPEEPTEFILDLKGHRIIAIEDNANTESGALILDSQGFARLTLTSSASGGSVLTDDLVRSHFHTIWVRGGSLTMDSPSYRIYVYSANSTVKRSTSGIRVSGGVAVLDDLYVEGMLAGDALQLSGGKTTVNGGSYHGGMDYYNQYLNQQSAGLSLLGGYEDYSWITNRTLGGDAIRVTGRAEVEINDASAYGGPHGAALHVDNRASAEYPCVVNVQGGTYSAEAGKGLLVESGNVDLSIHYGYFYYGDAPYGCYSMDVTTFGCIADYLAADRKVVNLSRYIGQVNGVDTYQELTDTELQQSYLWENVQVMDGPITATNAELDKMLEELPENITPETITPDTISDIKTAVGNMENLAAALEKDIPGDPNGTTEKLADLEKAIGEAEIEIENEALQINKALASVTGAVINAGGDVTLNIAQAKVEEKEELSEAYQNAQHFSLTLKANNEEVTLSTPVKVVLPVPANVNPALLMILHYNEQNQKWETITPTVYQTEDQWYMSFVAGSFSDFALAHKVSVLKDSENAGVWVTLDVHQNAAEDQRFLCAVYSEQGQMLSSAVINDEAFIKLGSEYYSAYEIKVFATNADDTWAPKYGADTIPLT